MHVREHYETGSSPSSQVAPHDCDHTKNPNSVSPKCTLRGDQRDDTHTTDTSWGNCMGISFCTLLQRKKGTTRHDATSSHFFLTSVRLHTSATLPLTPCVPIRPSPNVFQGSQHYGRNSRQLQTTLYPRDYSELYFIFHTSYVWCTTIFHDGVDCT